MRDVAEAHVRALESEGAWGRRFLLVGATPSFSGLADLVRTALPGRLKERVPTELMAEIPPPMFGAPPPSRSWYDCTPSESVLGLEYTPLAKTVDDTVEALLRHSAVSI